MTGLIAFAPWYVNGVLALFCVFALPGLVLAKAVLMDNFPLRWLIIFLASLATNHFLVTAIALFQLDPVNSYRAAIILATAALAFSFRRSLRSIKIELIDVGWFSLSIVVLGFAYFNIWKHGVPHVFEGGDVSASWNAWARIWAEGRFPISSYGYPQFVPTIWAVTYVFTGSAEEYFAFYIYLLLIIAPLVLNAMNLGRISWWYPLLQGTVFVWFVAEIQENWLRR